MKEKEEHVVLSEFDCSVKMIHKDVVNRVRVKMPARYFTDQLSDFFSLFGDSTRISILWALSMSEMCVCDICALLNMKQSAVSQQLKRLRQSRIIRNRREGKVVYYSLDDDHIACVLDLGMQHIREENPNERIE